MEYGMINVLRSDKVKMHLEIETIQDTIAGENGSLEKVLEYCGPF